MHGNKSGRITSLQNYCCYGCVCCFLIEKLLLFSLVFHLSPSPQRLCCSVACLFQWYAFWWVATFLYDLTAIQCVPKMSVHNSTDSSNTLHSQLLFVKQAILLLTLGVERKRRAGLYSFWTPRRKKAFLKKCFQLVLIQNLTVLLWSKCFQRTGCIILTATAGTYRLGAMHKAKALLNWFCLLLARILPQD